VRVKSLHVAEELSTRTSTSTSSATSASTRLLPSFSSSSSLNAAASSATVRAAPSSSGGFVSGLWGALTGAQHSGSAGTVAHDLSNFVSAMCTVVLQYATVHSLFTVTGTVQSKAIRFYSILHAQACTVLTYR
jgi:hypothetical protein